MFRRLTAYARKLLHLFSLIEAVGDRRPRPRIGAAHIIAFVLVMNWARCGSLNALEQTRPSTWWKRLIGRALPSADTIGRVCETVDVDAIRQVNHAVYEKLKRGKALAPPWHGLMVAVVDGHESHATTKRRCDGCLQRTIHSKDGDDIQYYHRNVDVMLIAGSLMFMLDTEPIRAGEDEVAAAKRLMQRVIRRYPRAFDVVIGDALYARADWFNFVRGHGKDALAVLKQEQRDLFKDVMGLVDAVQPVDLQRGKTHCQCWDLTDLATWPQCDHPVRVVRSVETREVRRQIDGQIEQRMSSWMWVTTLAACRASTKAVLEIGHHRWNIENQGFNELVNRWHGNHVYKHHDHAMLAFWLLARIIHTRDGVTPFGGLSAGWGLWDCLGADRPLSPRPAIEL